MGDLSNQPAPPTYRQVRLEDVDRAVRDWFDKTVDSHILDQNGQRQKVKVVFAAGERWITGRDNRGVRDRDGRLILPIIVLRMTGLDPVNGMLSLGSNVPTLQISRKIHERTNVLRNAMLSRPISTRRMRESTVYEVSTIPFPFNGVANYELVIQAQYRSHMNEVIEKMLSQLEFYDVPTFTALLDRKEPTPITQGDGESETIPSEDSPYSERTPLDEYYVCGYFDGNIGDAGNLEEFTDQERIIKFTGTFRVPVYLQLDPEGKRPAVQRQLTATNVRIGDETVSFVDDPEELEAIFGNGRLTVRERPKTR